MLLGRRVVLAAARLPSRRVTLLCAGKQFLPRARSGRPETSRVRWWLGDAQGTWGERRPRGCLLKRLKVKEVIYRQGVAQEFI